MALSGNDPKKDALYLANILQPVKAVLETWLGDPKIDRTTEKFKLATNLDDALGALINALKSSNPPTNLIESWDNLNTQVQTLLKESQSRHANKFYKWILPRALFKPRGNLEHELYMNWRIVEVNFQERFRPQTKPSGSNNPFQ